MNTRQVTLVALIAVLCIGAVFLVSTATGEGPFATVQDSVPSPAVAQPTAQNEQVVPSYKGGCAI